MNEQMSVPGNEAALVLPRKTEPKKLSNQKTPDAFQLLGWRENQKSHEIQFIFLAFASVRVKGLIMEAGQHRIEGDFGRRVVPQRLLYRACVRVERCVQAFGFDFTAFIWVPLSTEGARRDG